MSEQTATVDGLMALVRDAIERVGRTADPDIGYMPNTTPQQSAIRAYAERLAASPVVQAVPPADASRDEWIAAVRKVWLAARSDAYLTSIPSHWLEAMRDAALSALPAAPGAEPVQRPSDNLPSGSQA
jgi:hypothetical protein